VIQVDIYRLDRRLERSFEAEASTLCATLNRFAGRPFDTLAHFVMGEVSVMRVDLGRRGFAVLEHIADRPACSP
jgi:hypothetical protein